MASDLDNLQALISQQPRATEDQAVVTPTVTIAGGGAYPELNTLLEEERRTTQQAVQAATTQAVEVTPDLIAKREKLSKESGIPVMAIEGREDLVERVVRQRQMSDMARTDPVLARQLADPKFAALAQDDMETLRSVAETVRRRPEDAVAPDPSTTMRPAGKKQVGFWEGLWETLKGTPAYLASGLNSTIAGVQQFGATTDVERSKEATEALTTERTPSSMRMGPNRGAFASMTGAPKETPLTDLQRQDLEARAKQYQSALEVKAKTDEKVLQAAVEAQLIRPSHDTSVLEDAYISLIQSAPPLLMGTAVGLMTGSPALTWLVMGGGGGAMSFANTYSEQTAKGRTHEQAATSALLDMGLEAFGEALPVYAAFSRLPERALRGTRLFRVALAEGGEEMATQLLQDIHKMATIAPDMTWPEMARNLQVAALAGAAGGAVFGGAMSARDAAVRQSQPEIQRAQRGQQSAEILQELTNIASASKVLERSPESFAQYLQQQADESGTEISNVYVNARQFTEIMQQSGVKIPDSVRDQIREAVAVDSDVEIPVGDWAAQIATTDAGAQLLPLLKTMQEDGTMSMNQQEAEVFLQDASKRIDEQAARIEVADVDRMQWTSEVEAVKGHYRAQLQQANRFIPEVNEVYASMTGSIYAVLADKLQITPTQALQRYPFTVTAQPIADATMDQPTQIEMDADAIAAMPDDVRDNTEIQDFPGSSEAYNLYEARTLLPKPKDKLKKVTSKTFSLYNDYDYIANIDGVHYGISKYEDPDAAEDDEESFVYAYQPLRDGSRSKMIETFHSNEADLIAELRERNQQATLEQSGRKGGETSYVGLARQLLEKAGSPKRSTVDFMSGKVKPPNFDTIADLAAYFTEKNAGASREEVVDALYAETLHALTDTGNAIGWYDAKTKAALRILAEVHPEILTDEQSRFAFTAIMAITSNGMRSRDNFVIAEQWYREGWKATGRFPEEIPNGGTRGPQMAEALKTLNRLIDQHGWENVRDFMRGKHTAKEVKAFSGANSSFGEQMSSQVSGAVFLGPKIGSFFNNLYGDFSTITMDRWFMRTINRVQGAMLRLPGTFTANLQKLVPENAKVKAEIEKFLALPPEQQSDVLVARKTLPRTMDQVKRTHRAFAKPRMINGVRRSYADRSFENMLAKNLDMAFNGTADSPGGGKARSEIRSLIEDVQKRLRADGITMENADLQAVLWYYEKDLYAKLKRGEEEDVEVADETESDTPEVEAEDYETAARYAVARLREQGLFAGPAGLLRDGAGGGTLQQSTGTRGSITFGADITQGANIALLKNADTTTFFHEMGHFYLEVLSHASTQVGAPAILYNDFLALLKWFGVPDAATWQSMTVEQKRPHHEKFARGFEAYLFEGKAPSIELRGPFARIRAWMRHAYKSLTDLNVDLSDEVRSVFDRMLASEEAIKENRTLRDMEPVFNSPAEMQASAEEWLRYQALGEEVAEEATEQLQSRALRNLKWLRNARGRYLKELQAEAAGLRAEVREKVAERVSAEPVYEAARRLAEKDSRLSLPALKQAYGDGPDAPWRRFQTKGKNALVTEKGGLLPDQAAQMLGFTSGDELVRKLSAAPPLEEAIEAATDLEMLQKHGDITDQRSLEKAADEAVRNDARARFIATELEFLERVGRVNQRTPRGGTANLLSRAARNFAEGLIGRKQIRSLRPTLYRAAEVKAGKEAAALTDPVEKAAAKRAQLVNLHAHRAAERAADDVRRSVRYLHRVAESKTIDPEYLDQIHALLERFDLRASSQADIDRRVGLNDWIEAQRALGHEPEIPEILKAEARRKPYQTMTVEEFRGLVDAVRNIEHLGRLKTKLLTAKKQREFDATVDAIVDHVADTSGGKEAKQHRQTDRGLLVTPGKLFRQWAIAHRKFASVVREMDAFKDGGLLWELFVWPMNEAGSREADMRWKGDHALAKMMKPILKLGLGQKINVPEVGRSFTREERIGIALNTGNETNLERVLTGEKWTRAQLDAIMRTLSKQEMDFVQEIWDYLDTWWPQISEQHKRLTGVEPKRVEPVAVVTQHGTYRGGYYPIAYDPAAGTKAEAFDAKKIQSQIERGLFVRAMTNNGHIRERAESTGMVMRYDFANVVTNHISQVAHDLSWHEYLVDANRLLGDSRVRRIIEKHYGTDKMNLLKNQLRDIAVGDIPAQDGWDRVLNHMRHGSTIVGLGFGVFTSMLQPTGLLQSAARIGVGPMARGFTQWISNPIAATKRVQAMSLKMQRRSNTMSREVNDLRNKVSGKLSLRQDTYFFLIEKMQMVADYPTWLGAYDKAMRQENMTEEKAIALADEAVVASQGGGQIQDLAQIQRGGPKAKIWTNFMSFFNVTYNLAVERALATNFKSPTEVANLAANYLLLLVAPAMFSGILKHLLNADDEDDDEELLGKLAKEQITYLMGMMIGLRELSGVVSGFDWTGPAGTRTISDMVKFGKQSSQVIEAMWKDEDWTKQIDEPLIKSGANAMGSILHLPTGQIVRTIDGMMALHEGETENWGALIVGHNPQRK